MPDKWEDFYNPYFPTNAILPGITKGIIANIPFRKFLKSPRLFRFLVGPDKQEFFLHASLVASQSKVLDSLVNGAMKEAEDGCTTWENVSEDTFVRFARYIYTGDY